MKNLKRISLFAAFAVVCAIPCLSVKQAQAAKIVNTPSGYTSADQVNYTKQGNYVVNWGARGEDCTFLSKYAQSFYTGSYVYETVSQKAGGSSQSNAPSSALYSTLQTLMKSKHSHITTYDETRYQYCYTDCERNNYSTISCFYTGKSLSGTWDSGATWNREHCWPRSKCINQSKKEDSADLMTLRPTDSKENSSRGNKAYGESSSYYDPGESVRGDCARIVLYSYVRWGNTSYMWGSSGVMENRTVLLDWMEEDPVDTWEMARNDSVQSVTGTRNVFIDYPEYAWLLFGKAVPANMQTPSGIAESGTSSSGSSSSSSSSSNSSSDKDSTSAGNSSSSSSSAGSSSSNSSSDKDSTSSGSSSSSSSSDKDSSSTNASSPESSDIVNGGDECVHEFKWFVIEPATEDKEGYKEGYCKNCSAKTTEVIPKLESGIGCQSSVAVLTGTVFSLSACAFVLIKKKK